MHKITWIPSRFQLSTVTVQTNMATGQDDFELWAFYESEDGSLVYNITHYAHEQHRYGTEKGRGYKTQTIGGVSYDVVENNGNLQAHWEADGYSYILTGDLSEQELEHIIQSLK